MTGPSTRTLSHPDVPAGPPSRCDVLVVGAGPAGSAAARWLAGRGVRVVLADQRRFPRDKVCGDGLISDALGALGALGLHQRVAERAVHARELCLCAPNGHAVNLAGEFGCIPREDLDLVLRDGARETGALVAEDLTAIGPIERQGRVAGARFASRQGPVDIEADLVLLATGANAVPLQAFGLGSSPQPDAVAGRAYFEAAPQVAAQFRSLMIVYHREWCPGYGWIFPSTGNRFNIGVGLFAGSAAGGRLQRFWRFFLANCPQAAAIVAASRQVTPFRGAPLRIGLSGGVFGRAGLMAVGEAAATTYAATGEGIGKAMESGLLAAELAWECLAGRRAPETAHAEYGGVFRARFARRYAAYAVAQGWAARPLVLNLLATRARAGRFAREELEALVSERGDARRLFSAWGLVRALLS